MSEVPGSNTTLFDLRASVGIDATDFETGVASMSSSLDGLAGDMSSMVDTLDNMDEAATRGGFSFEAFAKKASAAWSGIQAVGNTIYEIGADLVNAYLEVDALERSFDFTFVANVDEAMAALERLADYSDYYAGQMKGNFTMLHNLVAAAGVDDALMETEEAMEIAIKAAAAHGKTLDDATESLMEYLRGNLEAGEAIGINVSEENMGVWAQRTYGVGWGELTRAQQYEALMAAAAGVYNNGAYDDAVEGNQTWLPFQLDKFDYIWRDMKAIIGEPIAEALGEVLGELNNQMEDGALQTALEGLGDVIGVIVGWVADLLIDLIVWAGQLEPEDVQAFLDNTKKTFASILDFFKDAGALFGGMVDFFVPKDKAAKDRDYSVINARTSDEALTIILNARDTGVGEGSEAFNEALAVLEALNADMADRLDEYYNNPNVSTEDLLNYVVLGTPIPQEINSTMGELSSAITALPGMLSGLTVQMDSTTVGVLVAPTVIGQMARSTRFRLNTGAISG